MIKINSFDKIITRIGEMDMSFVLNNISVDDISSNFLLYSEYYLLSPEMHKKVLCNWIKYSK